MSLTILLCGFTFLIIIAKSRWTYCRLNVPTIGGPLSSFFGLPSRMFSVFKSKSWIDTGYQVYSHKNRPFIVPSILEEPSLVVLPPSMISELILAKESTLSFWHALDDIVFSEHAFYSSRILSLPLQTTIIRRHLSSGALNFMDQMADQVKNTLAQEWGPSEAGQSRPVNLFNSLLIVVSKSVSIPFVGIELANDDEFQTSIIKHTEQVFATMSTLKFVPKSLKSWASRIIRRSQDKYRAEVEKKLLPLITERLENLSSIRAEWGPRNQPDDLIQWLIDCQASLKDPIERSIELEPNMIVTRVLMSYFVSVFLINVALFNAMMILIHPLGAESLSLIHREAKETLHSNHNGWTKEKINNLRKTDSFVKESMRFVGDACFELRRKVVIPGGHTLPDGTFLPLGTTVGVPSYAIHHDDRFYPEAATFDGLRFFKLRASSDADVARGSLLTATSTSFLQFGHGKHSCPGRFLAADMLKLIIAEVVLHYKFQWDGKPVQSAWFGNSLLVDRKMIVAVSGKN